MKKEEFLSALRQRLSVFSEREIREYVNYYREMIEDRMEEGVSEADAVGAIGSVDEVFAVILQETALSKLIKEKVTPKRKLKKWQIVLLSCTFFVWLPLLIAAWAVAFTLFVVLWVLILSLWVVELSFAAVALGGVALSVISFVRGDASAAAILYLSVGLVCAGLALLLFRPCVLATKGSGTLTKKLVSKLKWMIVRKETIV